MPAPASSPKRWWPPSRPESSPAPTATTAGRKGPVQARGAARIYNGGMTQPLSSHRPESARQLLASACPLDCPDSCSLTVEVADGRVVKLDGSRRNPLTAGFICSKVRRWPEHAHGPARLLHPAVRQGAKGEG